MLGASYVWLPGPLLHVAYAYACNGVIIAHARAPCHEQGMAAMPEPLLQFALLCGGHFVVHPSLQSESLLNSHIALESMSPITWDALLLHHLCACFVQKRVRTQESKEKSKAKQAKSSCVH
eukprot:1161032-Pelagomonas_calceolata.AAC.6